MTKRVGLRTAAKVADNTPNSKESAPVLDPTMLSLLGYNITSKVFSPSKKTQERALEKARQRYAQGGSQSLQKYLNHWRNWVHADFKCGVYFTEDIVKNIRYAFEKWFI